MSDKIHRSTKISSEAIFATPSMPFSRFIFGLILCLILSLLDLNTKLSYNLRGYGQDFLQPIYFLRELPSNLTKSLQFFITSRSQLHAKLELSKKQNHILKLQNLTLDSIKKENSELKSLINGTSNPINNFIFATKRSINGSYIKPFIVLDISSNKEIKLLQPVFSKHGLLGKVNSLGFESAEVILIQHPDSLIPILSSESNLHGILRGQGMINNAVIIDTKKTAKFKEGESILTSGLGGLIPPGYPIGVIEKITEKTDSKFLTVEVKLNSKPLITDLFLIYSPDKHIEIK